MDFNSAELQQLIQLAIQEDLGDGDHSSLSCLPHTLQGKAFWVAKQNGVFCGLPLVTKIIEQFDFNISVNWLVKEGEQVNVGQILGHFNGPAQQLLTAERTLLNFIQRLSGIATYTKNLTDLIAHTNCTLLDTRKTTPGFRTLEKYAVKMGGAANHRHGLYDMIMLKDNHIDFCGGITAAVNKTDAYQAQRGIQLPIEIETRNLTEVAETLALPSVTRIMLDNFSPQQLKKAVTLINGTKETEASGGITEANIVAYAETGVQFISVGALTHSVKSMDISMKVEFEQH